MHTESVAAFTQYFMAPIKLASVLYLAIFTLLIICLIKTIRSGVTELQQKKRDGNFQEADFLLSWVRVTLVLLIVSVFFGF